MSRSINQDGFLININIFYVLGKHKVDFGKPSLHDFNY